MQFSFFANALIWVPGDNVGLKHPANSCKQVAIADEVQKKSMHCRALKVIKAPFVERNFCLNIFMSCRHQSLKYCNGNIQFLLWKVIRVQGLTF